ncbi:ABC transporter ATP-binding protein [Nocardia coffeae]|uniref:ABC transporter ATP-binding protein n=1 Tax=Nocardia coffeae TaxID=2873381 RepID=UPI001F3606D7|nr:ABC transporter ATP-binding protein [Nocardia coffeae]
MTSTTSTDALLEVRDLSVTVPGGATLVDRVSFEVAGGERLAIVGESGSGKSVTARALLRLDTDVTLDGSVRLGGQELTTLTESELTRIRGRRASMVFQDPLSALHPTRTIGAQVAEPLIVHGVGRREARRRAATMLGELGIADAKRRMRAYPHEFSGGMRQRVAMAIALVGEPDLLIADEPTTALDVRVQEQLFALLGRVAAERSLAVVLITHDIGTVAGFADRVLVMYAGRVAEQGDVGSLLGAPRHPYAAALRAAVPRLDTRPGQLVALPGTTPAPADRPAGCAFHPRCPVALDVCRTSPPALQPVDDGEVACHLFREVAA